MRRRRLLIGIPLLIVIGLAATIGVFLLRGGNEPPPPALSAAPAGAAGTSEGTYRVADGSFVGYRVRETFASIGVTNAVGRTRAGRRAAMACITRCSGPASRKAFSRRWFDTATAPRGRLLTAGRQRR